MIEEKRIEVSDSEIKSNLESYIAEGLDLVKNIKTLTESIKSLIENTNPAALVALDLSVVIGVSTRPDSELIHCLVLGGDEQIKKTIDSISSQCRR